MKKRVMFLLSVVAGLILPLAHAANDAADGAHAQAAPQHRGMLYRIRSRDSTAYLFGTIHVGQPAFYPLRNEVTQALAHASRLVVELDVRNGEPVQAALQKHGMYADGDSIAQHLSSAMLAQLRQSLQRFGIPFEQVARLKPWLIMNMLIGLDLERHGYQRSHGIEFFLLQAAQQQTKTVEELESADYQLSLYDGMSEAEQEQYLRENLMQLDDGAALKKTRLLIDAWSSADVNAVEGMLRDAVGDQTLSSAFMQRVLLDKRNPEMATKIERLLNGGETSFVGVGLLHLVGENGVPSLLMRKGYAVEKLY